MDPAQYTIQQVAERLRAFLFEEKADNGATEAHMRLRICGYSAGRPLAEVWEVLLAGRQCDPPILSQGEENFGPRWDGQYGALDRLLLGAGSCLETALTELTPENAEALSGYIRGKLGEPVSLPAMPIQDAIDLARFLVDTTINFQRFAVRMQPKTVGGPIEIAVITKHEGFRWVQRKHFFPGHLNP